MVFHSLHCGHIRCLHVHNHSTIPPYNLIPRVHKRGKESILYTSQQCFRSVKVTRPFLVYYFITLDILFLRTVKLASNNKGTCSGTAGSVVIATSSRGLAQTFTVVLLYTLLHNITWLRFALRKHHLYVPVA